MSTEQPGQVRYEGREEDSMSARPTIVERMRSEVAGSIQVQASRTLVFSPRGSPAYGG